MVFAASGHRAGANTTHGRFLNQASLMRRTKRSLLSIPLAIVLAIAGAGCTGNESGGTPAGFMDRAGVQAEYDETISRFPYELPSGVTFPTDVQPAASDQPTIYQKGSGVTQAYQFWECAWQHRALDAQGTDQATVDQAVGELERGLSSIYQTRYLEDPDGIWKNTIDEAKLGDLSSLGEFYESDCTWYRAETGQ